MAPSNLQGTVSPTRRTRSCPRWYGRRRAPNQQMGGAGGEETAGKVSLSLDHRGPSKEQLLGHPPYRRVPAGVSTNA